MKYKDGEIVAGVKILSSERHMRIVRRTKMKGRVCYLTPYYLYDAENIDCGCTKNYTGVYLRGLQLKGKSVKCATHTRNEDERKKNRKAKEKAEVNRGIPKSDADKIVSQKPKLVGFVWGQQGKDNLRSYRLAMQV